MKKHKHDIMPVHSYADSGKENAEMQCWLCHEQGYPVYTDLKDHLFGVEGRWSFIKCKNCGLLWLYPRPSPDEIGSFYENYYTHEMIDEETWFRRGLWRGVPAAVMGYRDSVENFSERAWGRLFSLIGPLREAGQRTIMWLPSSRLGRLLDIGCGSGFFIRLMKRHGWDVYGVEPDPNAAAIAGEGLEPGHVRTGWLDDSGFQKESFDVVTMSHVIEHLLDPVDILLKIRNILKPGGLLIVAAPNSRSLGIKKFKHLWRGLEPPRHIYIYNPETLAHIITGAGFTVKSIRTPACITYLNWINSIKLKRKVRANSDHLPETTIFMLLISALYWGLTYLLTLIGFKCGEEVLITAERPVDSV